MIYALTGTNWTALKSEQDKLTDDFMAEHGDLALERIDCEEAEPDQLISAVESLPFLANKKLVLARNLSTLKEPEAVLAQIIEKAGESTDVIIVEAKVDKRSAYYKALKKLPGFKEYNELDQLETQRWVVEYAKQRSAVLSASDARYLVERIGLNQTLLAREIDKLSAYNTKITKETIDLLTEPTLQTTIFNLVDSIFSGNTKQALRLYEEQRTQRVEPQAIIGMLAWQLHVVALAVFAPAGVSGDIVAKDAGISPFVAKKSQGIARAIGRDKFLKAQRLLRTIDRDTKTKTTNLDDALRFFIISLAK